MSCFLVSHSCLAARLFAIGALSVPLCHAEVWDVGGATPDAGTVDGALALASDGDVIRVFASPVPGFTVGDLDVAIVPGVLGTQYEVAGTITLQGLSAGKAIVLVGAHVTQWNAWDWGLNADSCQGSLRLRDLNVGMAGGVGLDDQWVARIAGCGDVSLSDSTFVGRRGSDGVGTGLSGDGIDGEGALRIESSHVFLSRVSTAGGTGGDGYFGSGFIPGYGGDGGDATSIEASEVFASLCIFEGGAYGYDDFVLSFGHGFPGWGLVGTNSNIAWQEGYYNSLNAALNPVAASTRRISVEDWISDTATLTLTLRGQPGDLVSLVSSPEFAWSSNTAAAPWLVSPALGRDLVPWRVLGVVPASGQWTMAVPVGDLPPFGHRTLRLQAVFQSSAGRYLSNSQTALVLDSAW
ncbi:MAG: hypothetical protein R3F33_10325 [Planctomycetota bacterium]